MGSGRLRPQNRTDALQEPSAADSAEEQAESPRPGTARSDVPTPNVRAPGLLFSYSRHRRIPPDAGRIPPEGGDASSGPSPAPGRLLPAAGTCSPLSESQAVEIVRHARLHRAFRRTPCAFRRRLSAAVLPRMLSAVCLFCRKPFSTRRRRSAKSPHRMTPRPFAGATSLSSVFSLCHAVMRQREGGKRRRFFNMPGKIAFRKKKSLCAARRGIHAEAMPAAGCPPRKKCRIVGKSSETSGS